MNNIEFNVVNLFPTALGVYSLPREITKEELSFVSSLEKLENLGNYKSTNYRVLEESAMAEIKSFLLLCTQDYFSRIHQPKNDITLKITQSWCNYTEDKEFHHKHTHPNSFISGVFYFQTNQETDRIYFFDESYKPFKIPTKDYNLWNSDKWWVPSVTGQLLLFPSGLPHMVEDRPETGLTRISLSFNTFFAGTLGDSNDLTELIL